MSNPADKANREIVAEGVERLRHTYETFIHEKQATGYDFKFIDGQMIGHNFYKLLMWHIADEIMEQQYPEALESVEQKAAIRAYLVKVAIATLQRVLDNPVTNETDPELS